LIEIGIGADDALGLGGVIGNGNGGDADTNTGIVTTRPHF
jgi:hypothetical protein